MKENEFQSELIKKIKTAIPGCIVLKNDPNYIQGIPDLTILYGSRWAVLECKASSDDPFRPNQKYYLDYLGSMSFASVIYPEIEHWVLSEMKAYLTE